jgi:hypothetical protein
MHVLLRDPSIRFFVRCFSDKDPRSFPKSRGGTAYQRQLYSLGFLCMSILECRLQSGAMNAHVYESVMVELYTKFRNDPLVRGLETGQPLAQQADIDEKTEKSKTAFVNDGAGDAAPAILLALDALRCFIAFNWQSNLFQQHFLAYGSFPIVERTEMCFGSKCARGEERVFYGDNRCDSLSQLPMSAAAESAIPLLVRAGAADLAGALMQRFDAVWRIKNKSCTQVNRGQVCGEPVIMKKQMCNLPWMLYVRIYRDPTLALVPLRYNPDELLLGPTADGQYATYRLLARVKYAHYHFTVDVRRGGGAANKFINWNFDYRSEASVSDEGDTTSMFMLWQRVE